MYRPMSEVRGISKEPTMSRRHRAAFTLVELLVVIGIIALLISVLLPALSKAKQKAGLVKCSAQLHDIGTAMQLYVHNNEGYLPGPCFGQVRAGYLDYDAAYRGSR